ncbi:MAG: GntR family transcriptional regulator, partial [Desulfococcus multivorans]|nr:GntR family transcriptional regulator [Desulfococcus multivorans]
KVNKPQLADMLGVSQTPINDALSRLAGEKFIELKRRQGYFVRSFSDEELCALFEVRGGLESIAVRLCVETASDDQLREIASCFDGFGLPFPDEKYNDYVHADKIFHELVVAYSGNSVIVEIARTQGYLVKSNQKGLVRPPCETLPEHRGIIDAVLSRNPSRAQELMILHHLRSRDVFKETLRERSGGKKV